jgi:hypothetical protein
MISSRIYFASPADPDEPFTDAELREQARSPDPRLIRRDGGVLIDERIRQAKRVKISKRADVETLVRKGYTREAAIAALKTGAEKFTPVIGPPPRDPNEPRPSVLGRRKDGAFR